MWGIIIVCLVIFVFWRIGRAIFKPIFDFMYEVIIDTFMGFGMRKSAAKALVSVIIILLILIWLF